MKRKGLEDLIDEIEKRLTKEQLKFFNYESESGIKTFRNIMEAAYRDLYLNKNFEDCVTCSEIFISVYKDKFRDSEARMAFINEFGSFFSKEKPSKINRFLENHKLAKEIFFILLSSSITFLFGLLFSFIS